ncbi:MAG: hypothetical protein EU549_04185 [Promethearchaeota archaeon]|nr:MAG: hypothetical protein EU549_04185 [Candidatus Lokiarchaeota archaeon]
MTKVVSTRLEKEEIEELNKISQKERIDRSSLMRKFLLAQIEEYKLKEAGELYRKGVVSLSEAATKVDASIYKMMEYVEREKIRPPDLSREEMEEELSQSQEILNKIQENHD